MPQPPAPVRAVSFIDGQNLFHSAKAAFGYKFPNYNVMGLSNAVCIAKGWQLDQARFYSGVPDKADNTFWNHFWVATCAQMGREGVHIFTRPLRYRNKEIRLPAGTTHTFLDGDEKVIDLRLALDVIRLAHQRVFDVALLFCRDQDLSELADEIKVISKEQNSWIKIRTAPRLSTFEASTAPNGVPSTGPLTTRTSMRATIGRRRRLSAVPDSGAPNSN
jgi:uncharacterized LabA/DUF88 family protein